jgi:hypothetical protein
VNKDFKAEQHQFQHTLQDELPTATTMRTLYATNAIACMLYKDAANGKSGLSSETSLIWLSTVVPVSVSRNRRIYL